MSAATLGAADLRAAFSFATDWLGVYVDEVNALNVYPVPDGDTGTNMHLTLESVRRQLQELNNVDMENVAHALSYGSLLGARGNSGVILSQILKGFAESVRSQAQLGSRELAAAFEAASTSAYAAVLKPVEGTILTVLRRISDAADGARSLRPLELLNDAFRAGQEALKQTPELLPLLKQAGVVDAGGLGLLRIIEGLIAHFEGRDLPPPPVVTERAQLAFEEQQFGFCTEFLLADADIPAAELRELVEPFGDSLMVVGAEGFIKGHIHTEEPERLLGLVARHGRMVQTKVEDMSEQHSEILAGAELSSEPAWTSGLVAVADGFGLSRAFRSLGARVVGGGQTRNPSVEDIADAVRSVPAREVLILPNNPNIVLAAERAAELVSGRKVVVLPTRTYGQGLAAAIAFNPGEPLDALTRGLKRAAAASLTLEVTRASRDASLEGLEIEEGDWLGLADGQLRTGSDSAAGALLALLETEGSGFEFGTLFHGPAVPAAGAEEAAALFRRALPDLEIEVHAGGPDAYAFVMILE